MFQGLGFRAKELDLKLRVLVALCWGLGTPVVPIFPFLCGGLLY